MLARLSRSALSGLHSSSRSFHPAQLAAKKPLKPLGKVSKFPLSTPLFLSSSFSSSPLSLLHTRSYVSQPEIVEAQLADAIRDFNVDSTAQFDAQLLEDLLERNGWDLELVEGKVTLIQSFSDASVKIEILTESPSPIDHPMNDMENESHHDHHHHHHGHNHHHHNHHEDDHVDLGVLKGQLDYFNIVVSKRNVGEKMIFSCHAKEGVLEIDNVTLAHSGYNPSKPAFAIPTPQLSNIPSELTSDSNNRILSFADLPESLQSSFEDYLQQHGVNHDLAIIIYYSLFKHDLQYDQEWAIRSQKFLSSSK